MVIAGGKTGGHLFPGIAIAQAVMRINPDAKILFVGTGVPFESNTLSRYGFAHKHISSTGIKGKGIIERIKAILQIPISLIQAIVIINDFRPDVVIGVGGFSSGPVVLGARLCGVKTAIQEQNSIAGITNKILQYFAHIIFTSFDDTKGLKCSDKIVKTGNPIRKETMLSTVSSPLNRNEDGKKFTILVTGGSQGAKSINSAFFEALNLMKYREKYIIIHQTGAVDEERMVTAYKEMVAKDYCKDLEEQDNILVKAFFNDLPNLQQLADLIICRAGAGTISEITALGKAALLVPYPYAADDHQTYNAKSLVDKGAAWMLQDGQLSGESLKEKIEFAYSNRDELLRIANRAKELGNPFADEIIASICIKMANTQFIR